MAQDIILPAGIIGDLMKRVMPYNGYTISQQNVIYGGLHAAAEPSQSNLKNFLDHLLDECGLFSTEEFGHATVKTSKVEYMSDGFPEIEINRYRIEDIGQPYHATLEFFGDSAVPENQQVHLFFYYDRPAKKEGEPDNDLVSYHCGVVFVGNSDIYITDLPNEEKVCDNKFRDITVNDKVEKVHYYEYGNVTEVEPQQWLKDNTGTR